jgi:hypothetical protein
MKELELFIYSMENRIKLTRFILRELLQRHCLLESSRSEATQFDGLAITKNNTTVTI